MTLDNAAPAGGLTINVGVTDSGSYIAGSAPTEVVIAAGDSTFALTVPTVNDDTDEPAGSITAELTAGAGYTVGTPNTATVTVNDNDVAPPPVASITAGPSPITEGADATFTVTLDRAAPAGGLTINVGVTDIGSYISGSAPETVVIAEGATTGTLIVPTVNDNRDESNGSITAELNAGTGYTVANAPDNTATVTVRDNDVAPSPDDPVASITAADPTTITEGAEATFTVTLDNAAPAGGLTINVDVTDIGSYIDGSAPETVDIAAGARTGTLIVPTVNDATDETDGSITAELNRGDGYTVANAPDNTAAVTVRDNDVAPPTDDPVASISADPTTINEGTAATFTVTLDNAAPAGGLTVRVDVTQSGSYIDGSAPTEVVIAEGATTGTLRISTEDDSLDEPDGSITAELTVGTGYTVGTPNTARITVRDNDVASDRPNILLPITGGITPPWWVTLTLVLIGAGSLLLGFSLLLRGRVLGRVRSHTRPS